MSNFVLQDDGNRYWPRTQGAMLATELAGAHPFTTRHDAEAMRDLIHRRNGGKGPWRVVEMLTLEERHAGLVAATQAMALWLREHEHTDQSRLLLDALKRFE